MRNLAIRAIVATLAALALLGAPVAHAGLLSVVEFVSGTQFFTASPDEAGLLDRSPSRRGWIRTGFEFKAHDTPGPGLVPVCRFYSASSSYEQPAHFFTAFPEECEAVKADPGWIFEGEAFYATLPDALGNCPAGNVPIYRIYWSMETYYPAFDIGYWEEVRTPRHGLTPMALERVAAVASGWISEGVGPVGVAFCVLSTTDGARSRLEQFANGTWELTLERPFANAVERVVMQLSGAIVDDTPFAGSRRWTLQRSHSASMTGSYYINGYFNPAGASGTVGWSPLAGKMIARLDQAAMDFAFDYTGGDTIDGCAYYHYGPDYGYWDYHDNRTLFVGPCYRVTGQRR